MDVLVDLPAQPKEAFFFQGASSATNATSSCGVAVSFVKIVPPLGFCSVTVSSCNSLRDGQVLASNLSIFFPRVPREK